jgi:hypothetical protein
VVARQAHNLEVVGSNPAAAILNEGWGVKPQLFFVVERFGNSSMIPEFNENGLLPAGIHSATIAEVEGRFGQESEIRRAQMQSLLWLHDLAKQAGVERLIINGSFVTDVLEPNDVDCILLLGADYPRDAVADHELTRGLPFLHIDLVTNADFEHMVEKVFATDRRKQPKGMVELTLWN